MYGTTWDYIHDIHTYTYIQHTYIHTYTFIHVQHEAQDLLMAPGAVILDQGYK